MLIRTTLFAALLTGCANNAEQIWVLDLSPPSDPVVSDSVSHNFIGATSPEWGGGAAEWLQNSAVDTSNRLFFAQLVRIDGDEDHGAILIVDGAVFPGVEGDKGSWTFEWSAFDDSTDSQVHEAGYAFRTVWNATSTTTITWTEDPKTGTASGTIAANSEGTTTYTETDSYDVGIVGVYPQIPAWGYLVDPDGYPVQNRPGTADCTAEPCQITLASSSDTTTDFTATLTDFVDESAYDAVEDAEQPFGF